MLKTKPAAVAVTVAAVLALAACGGSSGSDTATGATHAGSSSPSTEAKTTKAQPFKITESAYKLIPDSTDAGSYYVEWAAAIENPNTAWYGAFPKITITALDSAGSVLGTDTQVLNALPPGATEGFAGQVGAKGGKPATVKIEYSKIDWYPTKTKPSDYPAFSATGATFRVADYDSKTTGTLTNPYKHDWDSVAVTSLYYDSSGKLIGGATTFVDDVPANGSKPFEVNDMFDMKTKPASIKIMAMPWGGSPEEWNQVVSG